MSEKKVALLILDGFGLGKRDEGNAIYRAKKPFLDTLFSEVPFARLHTEGVSVGLPDGQTGGSEPGHITLGAGRPIVQNLTKINDQILSGEFFENPVLKDIFEKAAKKGRIHLVGMISDGGIHSYQGHLSGLLEFAKKVGISSEKTFIHAITDGRDVGERTALGYLEEVRAQDFGVVATLGGRFFGMDRDQNWERTEQYWEVMADENSELERNSAEDYIRNFYENSEKSDYYIPPVRFLEDSILKADDVVVFWNFRSDRGRQLSAKIVEKIPGENFGIFGNFCPAAQEAFVMSSSAIKPTLGSVVSDEGMKQLRISETEKFNHVTFFFSGEQKEEFAGESRILIPSPKCTIYSDKPECAAREQVVALKEFIENNPDTNLIVQNFANADLVGHSGKLEAAIEAIEVVDTCVREEISFLRERGFSIVMTADHGNADSMILDNGDPNASHTNNLVPLWILSDDKVATEKEGGLADVAVTILDLMGIEKPVEMTGNSLAIQG